MRRTLQRCPHWCRACWDEEGSLTPRCKAIPPNFAAQNPPPFTQGGLFGVFPDKGRCNTKYIKLPLIRSSINIKDSGPPLLRGGIKTKYSKPPLLRGGGSPQAIRRGYLGKQSPRWYCRQRPLYTRAAFFMSLKA